MQGMSGAGNEATSSDGVLSRILQGTQEWKQLRCGRVTASRVADIVRRTKSGASASRARYLGELVAERLTGTPQSGFETADMKWGKETEPMARQSYSFTMNIDIAEIAFINHPKIEMSGCSPDGLVGQDGLIEIKSPTTHVHLDTLLGSPIDPDYVTQMMWQLACTGRKWCDFVSFDPRMPPDMQMAIRRVHRDAIRIAELEAAVRGFISDLDQTIAKLHATFRASAAA